MCERLLFLVLSFPPPIEIGFHATKRNVEITEK